MQRDIYENDKIKVRQSRADDAGTRENGRPGAKSGSPLQAGPTGSNEQAGPIAPNMQARSSKGDKACGSGKARKQQIRQGSVVPRIPFEGGKGAGEGAGDAAEANVFDDALPLPAVALIFGAVVDSCERVPESFSFEIRSMVRAARDAGWSYDAIAATLIGCCQKEAEAFGKSTHLAEALPARGGSHGYMMHTARELQMLRARHRYTIALMVAEEALEQLLEVMAGEDCKGRTPRSVAGIKPGDRAPHRKEAGRGKSPLDKPR